ncbi:SDR family NAD-dependent epimerase/dehydratase, partial [Bacteroides thetaiotaomicron]|nr:SDR family NAD-dependent epimerase/dehydratase [Bacteroides thetaiotaomicron]
SICELPEMVALKSRRKVVFDIPDKAVSNPPDKSKTILSTDKINEIGWFPQWNLEEGISHTLNTFD